MKRKNIKKITINKKTIVVFLIIVITFILFIFIINKPKSYNTSYNINKYLIKEKYNKKDHLYTFNISINNKEYIYTFNTNYIKKRKLINKIKVNKNTDNICILPVSNYIKFYPICYQDSFVTLNLVDNKINYKYKKISNINKTYNKIKIYNLYNNYYLIYNYDNFIYLGDNSKKININTNNEYSLDNLYQYNNYLIIPIIDNYYIQEFNLININNSKVYKIKLDNKISKDIRYLGNNKNYVYFIDNKESIEYKLNIKKKVLEELTTGIIIKNNKEYEYPISDIIKKDIDFININKSFILENNILYKVNDNIKIKVTNNIIDKIININNDEVYYLSKGVLYVYNMYDGDIKLLENFEWNFNKDNQIYIFNK